ncbi:FAD-dependent pyridine oxidoreductase YtfP [Thermobacillus xylanilyticus]|jgi:predicted Rossmann fold flavoprotein|uniref:FAD-dependent pyridine oxidoreductase YtfP n=1 Tax=Thermobacillus xylanilyticus TaxID=76633 RepID=A0ABN7RL73_THEXY|nr:NAD(P)/FAD-dependent oxidoreductase [Thermobacillus xylanilyticus]CAG5077021.1 FAD-dependent pyridine oxidoreductase YtfP [Thermobacillus xylanilyticus]
MDADVLVIGGGPSGLMASIAAAERGARVVLLDKGDKLGRKLAISGGGRCNVTNAKPLDELIRHIPGGGRFLYSAFSVFSNRDIIAFFEKLGIKLKEENDGRMFPVTDSAQTVVRALIGRARELGVDLRTNRPVADVLYEDGAAAGVKLKDGSVLRARAVIVATGGKSVPHTGSTGDGYPWAEKAGHTITELYPTEVPLTSNEPWIKSRELQGVSLRGVALSVWDARGRTIVRHEGDMIFTHFGLSGPIALRCSQFVVKERKKNGGAPVKLTLDLKPEQTEEDVYGELNALAAAEPKRAVKNALRPLMPERLLLLMLRLAGIAADTACANISRQALRSLARLIKAMPILVNGTLPLEQAFITGGGVSLKEVDPRTMQSKLMPGLFFCGEILDVHGYTGGYNITAAFATGYSAGKSAAELAAGPGSEN